MKQPETNQDTITWTGSTSSHVDTIIDGKHVIVDTIRKTDTVIIEKVTYDKEIQIIEKIMQKPDAGKSVVSVLILLFCIYSLWKKWNHKNQKE
mgnify:CR=1 FL=1